VKFFYGLPTQYMPIGGFVEELYGGGRPGGNPLVRLSEKAE
jgi:hypothetical protein